ncbi:hypothetical protein ACIGZJ_31300 [Kitasatospora sp. NPDC052868]|uniref:hypothetical protein n=1 Tax=Kitasatospora sp. NPDC052868 TaxID=3364060 RepID=UPI0037CC8BA7
MTVEGGELCRHCGEPIARLDDQRWAHGRHGFGEWGSRGCRSYSFTLHGDWDERLTRSENAQPRTRAQLAGREEFPSWPGLQQRRLAAERKEREAAALAATRFSAPLARAVKAAEAVVANPENTTFRALERKRAALCLAIEEQARRGAEQQGHHVLLSGTVREELSRLMQLTKDLFVALRAAEDHLPPAEALKAAVSRYSARLDRAATERSAQGYDDGSYTERSSLHAARERLARQALGPDGSAA